MQRRTSLHIRRNSFLAALVIAVALVVACGGGGDNQEDINGLSVTGHVIGLEATHIARFDSLAVIDSDRNIWQFTGGEFAGFTPSHLRAHQASGERITVWYVEEDDKLRAIRIADAS